MNLQALPLFFALLLMQAGAALAVSSCTGSEGRSAAPAAMSCATGCCAVDSALNEDPAWAQPACACLSSLPVEGSAPESSSIPASSSGRELLPQVTWVPAVASDLELVIPPPSRVAWGLGDPLEMRSPQRVALQVLHCAFLL